MQRSGLIYSALVLVGVVLLLARSATATANAENRLQNRQSPFPFFWMNFTEIVQYWGYPCEEHHVQTDDGYILTLFRIPPKTPSKRPPVLLQHGLVDSSFTWIVNTPNESLPYILHDAGFDVWLGNNRGNIYSMEHISLKPSDPKFWDFTWDDMALHDVPSVLSHILKVTNYSRMGYVGHSQGTIQMFAALASGKVPVPLTTFIGLGPVVTVKNEESLPLRFLADIYLDQIVTLFGLNDFLPKVNNITNPFLLKLFVEFCTDCESCCDNMIELLCGQHQGAFNDSLMPWIVTNEPGGTSVKNVAHWAQAIRSGVFQMYDYGWLGNLEHYGQLNPPSYNLSAVPQDLPMAMYSGGMDLLADPTDVAYLMSQLPASTFLLTIPQYAHLDFVWATDAHELVYAPIVQQLLRWNV